MFDFLFGRKKYKEPSNVVPFPKPEVVPPMPKVNPPKEEPATTFYRIGLTDNNRVSFSMGYSEITMTKLGVQNLIDQLTVFMDQLGDDNVDV